MLDRSYKWGDKPLTDCTRDEWLHHWTIEVFLMHLTMVRALSSEKLKRADRYGMQALREIRDRAAYLYPLLSSARVYEFDPDAVIDMYNAVYETGWPSYNWDELPFEEMFIGLGPGLPADASLMDRLTDKAVERIDDAQMQHAAKLVSKGNKVVVNGYLVTSTDIYRMVVMVDPDIEWSTEAIKTTYWLPLRVGGRWIVDGTTEIEQEAHLIVHLLKTLESVRSVVTRQNGLAHKRDWAKRIKKASAPRALRNKPPQYYQVKMRPGTQPTEEGYGTGVSREYSHRFDREAHYRHKIRRGKLPLDDKLAERLQRETRRGNQYQIWATTQPPQWVDDLLRSRGMPRKNDDEWIAVMRWRVPHTVIGPEDKPYIPAARKLELKAVNS